MTKISVFDRSYQGTKFRGQCSKDLAFGRMLTPEPIFRTSHHAPIGIVW